MGLLKNLMVREIKPLVPATKEAPRIPRILQKVCIISNEPYQSACEKYGVWTVKLVRETWVMGQLIPAGEEIRIPGNLAHILVTGGDAIFVDSRLEEEERIISEAKRLGLNDPPSVRGSEAFAPPKERRRPWVAA